MCNAKTSFFSLRVLNQTAQVQVQSGSEFADKHSVSLKFVMRRVVVSDRGDSEHCVICCTEIHCTVIQPEGADSQSAIISSISIQFDLVFKFRLWVFIVNIKVSHELKAHDVFFVPKNTVIVWYIVSAYDHSRFILFLYEVAR